MMPPTISRKWWTAALVACALGSLALGGMAGYSTAVLTDDAVLVGNTFTTAASFGGGGSYVWDQAATVTSKGSKYKVQVAVTVREDSDGNGVAAGSDPPLQDVTVAFELRDAGSNVVASDSGVTDAQGQFTTARFNNVAVGSYTAVVTSLTHATITWSPGLDAANPAAINVP